MFVCVAAGFLLRRTDARLVASVGFICVCIACLMVAYGLTPLWGTDQFLPSQLLQAVGQSFALSGTIFFAVLHLRPQDALTFGAATQVARLMGGEVGQAFIATLIRVRGQIASNLLGLHVQIGDAQVIQRLQTYAAATARAGDPSSAPARGAAVLGGVVRSAAITQGIMDGFIVIAVLTAVTLLPRGRPLMSRLSGRATRPRHDPSSLNVAYALGLATDVARRAARLRCRAALQAARPCGRRAGPAGVIDANG
jgi:DHA2 family multidrug resistance protein